MADVNPTSRLTSDDRGQLFLITALAVAVMLVSLALILNTAIYTENIATRTTDTQLDDAFSGQRALVEASGEIMDAENRNGGSGSEIETRFDSSLTNWSETAGTLEASNGFTLAVSYTGTNTTGLRIHQDDPSRNFTDNTSNSDWEVIDDGRVRGIRFNVSQDRLSSTESNAFTIYLDDQGGVGNDVDVSMHANNSNVVVTVQNDTGLVGTCEVEPLNGDALVVDIGSKVVGDRYCAPLEAVHDGIDGEVDVRFEDAHNVAGTYELYATGDEDDLLDLIDGSEFAADGSGYWPVQQDAIYDANVTFVFRSSGTTVEKEVQIAPGEL